VKLTLSMRSHWMRSLWMRALHSVPSRVLWNKTAHKIITDHQDRLDDEDLLD